MTEAAILADLGNSRLKLGWLHRGALRDACALPYAESAVMAWARRPPLAQVRPDQVLICAVVNDDRLAAIRRQLERRFGCPARQVRTPAAAHGVRVAYAEPRRLGVDRYVAMVGAHRGVSGHKLVVDAGTAMTLDALCAQGEHLGGYIVPGLGLQRDALRRKIAAVAARDQAAASLTPGRDTPAAASAGELLALTGAIESAYARAGGWAQGPLRVVLTGGDAPLIARQLTVPYELRPWLVLQGLAVIAGG